MQGDMVAWVFFDVDRRGRPLRCAMGHNNITDPERRFWVCKAFKDNWTATAAQPGEPNIRTIKRQMVMKGYEHQMADQKARKQWFRDHPDERPECYPE